MNLRLAKLSDLKPDPNNAREHGEENLEAIEKSLRSFEQVEPLVVQKSTGMVIGGNGRLAVMTKMGLDECWVVEVEVDDQRARALGLALNRTAELSDWNQKALADLLATLPQDVRCDVGWTDADYHRMCAQLNDGQTVEDEAPPPEKAPVSRRGDLWLLGEHRLLCGDSTDGGDVAIVMGDQSIDLCVTSPPYNCDIQYESHDDKMPVEKYLAFIGGVVSACVDKVGSGRFVAWNVGVTPKSRHFDHARILADYGLEFWRQIVWAKSGVAFPIWQYTTAARKYHPNYTHEVIYLFSKGVPLSGGACDIDEAYSRDVWTIHQSAATRDLPGETDARRPRTESHGGSKAAAHPAAYPVGIPVGCIKHLTMRGENVYDPFSGSGTTIIAAEQLNRRCFAIEIAPRYVDVAVRRWQALTGLEATLDGDGRTFAQVRAERLGAAATPPAEEKPPVAVVAKRGAKVKKVKNEAAV